MDEERNRMDKLIELMEHNNKQFDQLISLTKDMHKSTREMAIRLQEIKAQTG